MLAKRLAAVIVAAALVVGALWWRSRDDGDGDDGPATPGATTTAAATATELICITELADACAATGATTGAPTTVEAAGDTIDRLASEPDPGPVAWATVAPLPQLVDDLRARNGLGLLFTGSNPLASSRLALVARTPQSSALAAHCGGAATWKCLGDVAGGPWSSIGGQASWGDVQPAHEAPDSSATGLLTFANAVVSFFGRADIGTADLESDAFADWVRRLERAVPDFGGPQGTPFEQLLLRRPSSVVGTTDAEIASGAGARRNELTVTYPAPMAQADAVLATSAAVDVPRSTTDVLVGQLEAGGWGAPSEAPPGGLPAPGVLQALRTLWQDVTR
jgi:hypothetical protein